MAKNTVITLDLNFQGKSQAIAAYLIHNEDANVLVECGPGSSLDGLNNSLRDHGLSLGDITHVFLTHIHLDHAGAAGWFSRQGADIFVHPLGAPHLLNPEKLLASATRIYGERMEPLWGEFLPVVPERLQIIEDGQDIKIGNLHINAFFTPGHAIHHCVYRYEDVCFSGDVGGVRIPGYPYLQVPMPPPDLDIGQWRETVRRLREMKFKFIAPTHFGIFDDPEWHLQQVDEGLQAAEHWMETTMPQHLTTDQLRESFTAWMEEKGRQQGLNPEVVKSYQLANPLGMSADGLARYWKKTHTNG
jgi:glyoxylase-like metal-dependent hydrolase (beta-lactamase superfamily II)